MMVESLNDIFFNVHLCILCFKQSLNIRFTHQLNLKLFKNNGTAVETDHKDQIIVQKILQVFSLC